MSLFLKKMPMVYCVDERAIVEEPYQTPEHMARKKGFVIIVQELYKWKNLPVAKVLFCDCHRFAEMLRNNSSGTQLMGAFVFEMWLRSVQTVVKILADEQVSLTLSRALSLQRNGPGNEAVVS